MPAKTYTITALGTTAAQTMDDTTTLMMVDGVFDGELVAEVSREGTRWAAIASMDRSRPTSESAVAISVPRGWQVRFVTRFGSLPPSLTIDIE
jgi:hypothetical protein